MLQSAERTPAAEGRRTGRTTNREKLVAAALAEFADAGYASASVDRIAERAGLTKGAFYSQFESKQDALHQALEAYFLRENERILAQVEAMAESEASLAALSRLIDRSYGGANLKHSLLAIEFQLLAARDASFAALYDRLFATQVTAAQRSVEAIFAKAGKQIPIDAGSFTAGLIALANGLLLQATRGPAGGYTPGALYGLFYRALLAAAPARAVSGDIEAKLRAATSRLTGDTPEGRLRLLQVLEGLEALADARNAV